jgi:hypothetical protein
MIPTLGQVEVKAAAPRFAFTVWNPHGSGALLDARQPTGADIWLAWSDDIVPDGLQGLRKLVAFAAGLFTEPADLAAWRVEDVAELVVRWSDECRAWARRWPAARRYGAAAGPMVVFYRKQTEKP